MAFPHMNIKLIQIYKKRKESLLKLGFNSYEDYLKSDYWKKIKKKREKSNYWKKCCVCDSDKAIQIHHLKYRNMYHLGCNAVPLCKNCHNGVHEFAKGQKNMTLKRALRIFKKNYENLINNK